MKRVIAVLVSVIFCLSFVFSDGHAKGISERESIPLKDYELVRNGGFHLGNAAWLVAGTFSYPTPDAAFDRGGSGLSISAGDQSEPLGYALQQVYPPTMVSDARISMNYRIAPQQNSYFGGFQIAIASTVNNQMQPLIPLVSMSRADYSGTNWQTLSHTFTKQQVNQINSTRAKGLPVYIYVAVQGSYIAAHIDNVSFVVSGEMEFPAMGGRIALTLNDDSKVPGKFQIWTLHPDGQNAKKYFEAEGACYGLNWRPDGKAVVFSSSHEKAYSRFSADIYELQGANVRKITNPPSHSEIVKSGRGKGIVVGKVYNRTDRNIVTAVHVEGADELVFVSVGPYPNGSHTADYKVPNVTDMGSGEQYINAREGDYVWLAALGADVVAGRTVQGGDIYLTKSRNSFTATSPSYSSDGKNIFYSIPSLQVVPVTGGVGQNPYGWKGSINAISAAHSPGNNAILYQAGFGNGIYLINNGGEGVKLNGLGPEEPSWLADSSGFVYVLLMSNPSGKNIHYYNFANRKSVPVTQLYNEWAENPSVSPDGRYIVFERVMSTTVNYDVKEWREVWIMQSDNPNIMWPLVRQGNPRYPVWK